MVQIHSLTPSEPRDSARLPWRQTQRSISRFAAFLFDPVAIHAAFLVGAGRNFCLWRVLHYPRDHIRSRDKRELAANVFVHILNGFARVLCTDQQCGLRMIADLIAHGNAGDMRKIGEESLGGAIDARFPVSFEFDREGSINWEHAGSQSHA